MKPLETLDRVMTPDGKELALYRRGSDYQIRIDGLELMTSRAHGSEEALAHLACQDLATRPAPRVLVGGLGMGFTLRAALDSLPRSAEVEVAEVFSAVVTWNRGPLASLAGRPLDDRRTVIQVRCVGDLIREHRSRWDSVLLDVDNGPSAFTLESNQRLYESAGLGDLQRALRPGGILALWSAHRDDRFVRRLRRKGFSVEQKTVRARQGKGPRHTLYLARQAAYASRRLER